VSQSESCVPRRPKPIFRKLPIPLDLRPDSGRIIGGSPAVRPRPGTELKSIRSKDLWRIGLALLLNLGLLLNP
jgi:hypothetical protein